MQLSDYTIDLSRLDLTSCLRAWSWLLSEPFHVHIMNCFGDVFLTLEDRSVQLLSMDSGDLKRLAASQEEFARLLEDPPTANDWLLIPLVGSLRRAGRIIQQGQCYGFRLLPVLGGSYEPSNIVVQPVTEYLAAVGQLNLKIRDYPDGTKVRFKIQRS